MLPISSHIPVLLNEVLDGLRCDKPGVFLDCTVGCGGHTAAILEQHAENRVIGIDCDAVVLDSTRQSLAKFGSRIALYHHRFEEFEDVMKEASPKPMAGLAGILVDLGVSSVQFDDAARGFSFQHTARLDMRMDTSQPFDDSLTAYMVVNTYSAEDLARIFYEYGEERHSRRIARMIVAARTQASIETTTDLADMIFQAIPRRFHPKTIHPATRVFQAIRIEVNQELRQLGDTLERAVHYVQPGGRICVIAFHSLEDRIVKRTFAKLAKGCQCPPNFPQCVCGKLPLVTVISRKPIMAAIEEQQHNPRSRSAKLRIAEKLA